MNIKSIIGMISLSFLCLSSSAAQAAIVTWTFSGTINDLGTGGNEPVPGINLGDAVTGTAIYDTNTSPTDLGWATGYDLTTTGGLLTIEVSGLTFSTTTAGSRLWTQVYNDRPSYGDVVFIESINMTEDDVFNIQIADQVEPYDLLSDESLPTYLDFLKAESLNPDGIGGNYGFIQSQAVMGDKPYQTALFSIDSFSMTVVPVPAAVWLFGSGLIGLIGVARRKKV